MADRIAGGNLRSLNGTLQAIANRISREGGKRDDVLGEIFYVLNGGERTLYGLRLSTRRAIDDCDALLNTFDEYTIPEIDAVYDRKSLDIAQ
ncbi:MAG: hypothetical protein AAFN11_04225 [Chloroflexota bacterium]